MRELNLLPPQRRRQLSRQLVLNSLVRFLHSALWAIGTMTMVGVALGVGFHVAGTYLSNETTTTLQTQVKRYQELRSQIAKENDSLSFMAGVTRDRIVWSGFFKDVFGTLSPGTRISAMTGTLLPAPHLSFSGQATSRSSLVVLADRLKALPWVKEVGAPNSNLLQRVNPTYTFDAILRPSPEKKP